MKKMMKMAVLAAALTLSANASAQLKFGLKGGINTSEVSVNDDVWETDCEVHSSHRWHGDGHFRAIRKARI